MPALHAQVRAEPWTCTDPRFPDAASLPCIGPLSDEMAEMVASYELCRGILTATADWSNVTALTRSSTHWPRRVPEMQAGHRYHLAYWHGEEAFQIRKAIYRSGRHDRITVEGARRAVEWRLEYLRQQLMKMAGDSAAARVREMLDGLRLTYGRDHRGTPRWYAFDSLA